MYVQYLSIYLSFHLSITIYLCTSTYLSISASIYQIWANMTNPNQSINQPINQPINQSINLSTNHSINQINQSFDSIHLLICHFCELGRSVRTRLPVCVQQGQGQHSNHYGVSSGYWVPYQNSSQTLALLVMQLVLLDVFWPCGQITWNYQTWNKGPQASHGLSIPTSRPHGPFSTLGV